MDRTLWPAMSNTIGEKDINFKFFVDAANPPTLVQNPLSNYVTSCIRTSQGLYTLTFADAALQVAGFFAELSLNTPIGTYAQVGATTGFGASFNAAAPPTAIVYILNSAGAVTDPPAANPNVFVSGTLVLSDVAKG